MQLGLQLHHLSAKAFQDGHLACKPRVLFHFADHEVRNIPDFSKGANTMVELVAVVML